MDYWKECISEAADECGATLVPEQIAFMARFVEGAHENYSQATGMDVADRNWRASEDRRLVQQGAEKVLQHVEACVATIDSGPARAFNAMSHDQRLAMHELFQTRAFVPLPR